jgi:hypothetical protein
MKVTPRLALIKTRDCENFQKHITPVIGIAPGDITLSARSTEPR